MCGILGFVAADGEPASRARLLASNERMRARGPDGAGDFCEGSVALAMRRLAVIDVEGGGQPLFARDGEVVVFQNGEIYNHAELRRELESAGFVFRTKSDTEALAHGYVAWGMDGLLQRVDGMHAIALLDRRERQLWLARDRFGEKPLFVARDDAEGARHDDPRLAFASSLKAIGGLLARPLELDPAGVDAYLALHFVPGRRTIFRGVERVLPGERWRIDLGTGAIERRRFFELPLPAARPVRDDELMAALDHAVRSRLVADVPVGVFLSGGLDSSLLAALAARARPGIDTFSMGFTGSTGRADAGDADETRFAELVARHVGSRHHTFQFDAGSFLALFGDVAAALDEPVGDPAQLPLLWLCREARKLATVALSGEGADELFGGYDYYSGFAPAIGLRERWARWRGRPAPAASARLLETDERALASGFPFVLSRAQRRALLPRAAVPEADDWERDLLAQLRAARDPLQRASAADLLTWLPDDLLVKFDRMAMATSLEGRAPYLDPELAALALALPPAERSTVTRRKVALARVAAPLLPPEIVGRAKHGFVLPMKRWLAELFATEGGAARWFAARAVPPLETERLIPYLPGAGEPEVRRTRPLFALALLHAWHAEFRAQERAWLAEANSASA